MSKTLEQRIDAGEIEAGDITKPDKGMTFYLDGYGEFQFQFPAPCWMPCNEDEQDGGMMRAIRKEFLRQVAYWGKIAEGVVDLDHLSVKGCMTVLVQLYRRIDAYLQYWMWTMKDSDEAMFDVLSEIIANDNPDVNNLVDVKGLGDLLKMLGGDR